MLGHAVVLSGAIRSVAQRLVQPMWLAALVGLLAASVTFGSAHNDADDDGDGADVDDVDDDDDDGELLDGSGEKVHVGAGRCR